MNIKNPKYVWMDGKIVDWDQANISILSHALHYGTGIFEGIRAYPTENDLLIFRLEDHIKRMFESAKIYYIDIGYDLNVLCSSVIDLIRKNNMKGRTYIRPITYVGYGGIGLNFTGFPIHTAICTVSFENYFEKDGLNACTSSWRRISDSSTPPLAKATGNYINSVLAKLESLKNGYDEAILLDHEGFVSEGSAENILIVKDNEIHTPPISSSILNGITRDTVIRLANDLKINVVERNISRTELYTCDEAFFTGTAAEVTSILEIDHRKVKNGKNGKITSKLRKSYQDLVHGRNKKYSNWLTSVYLD